MNLINARRMPDNFNLFLMGDVHHGSTFHSYDKFEDFKSMIHTPYKGVDDNYIIDHGDIADCITSRDSRYHPDEVKMPVRRQEELAYESRKIFHARILAILDGNHPFKMWDVYGPSGGFTKLVCDRLGVPYGTTSCKISYWSKDGDLMFKSFHQHGRLSNNSKVDDPVRKWANMKINLKRHLKMLAGDAILMCEGHTHKIITVKPQKELYLVDDGERIVQKYTSAPSIHHSGFIAQDFRWYANTGSFLKMYSDTPDVSGYAERAGYDPVELGFVIAPVRDRKIVSLDRIML